MNILLILLTSAILAAPVCVVAQEFSQRWFTSECRECESTLEFSLGSKPPSFISEKMLERAIHLEAPSYPPMGHPRGTIIVNVLVNNRGEVECIRMVRGHPLLACSVAKASEKWRFKPVIWKGQPRPYMGHLKIRYQGNTRHVSFVR